MGKAVNALIITLWASPALCLPLAYQSIVQGALYAQWRDTFPMLHDEGYQDGNHAFRLFTFSPLQGRYRVEGKSILFTGPVSLEVRSPAPELIAALSDSLTQSGIIRLSNQELPLVNLSCADRLLFFPLARLRMIAPVTMHRRREDGGTEYLSPMDAEFPALLAGNLAAKLRACGSDAPPLIRYTVLERTLRKRVTTFRGIYITGWMGDFLLEADPEVIALLYYAGLGDRNSQGFGMFAIEAGPPPK